MWKDEKNILPSGLTIDLNDHLARQRLSNEWVASKEKVLKMMNLAQYDDAQEIKILDIDLLLVAEEATRLGKIVSMEGDR